MYWKNGSINYLTDGSSFSIANSICVNGSDVYVVGDYSASGSSSSSDATLWKNSVPTNLTTNSGTAQSVFIKNGDVYVCGYDYDKTYTATIWKNNKKFHLSDGTKKEFANSVVIR